jgi:protein-S-isoprenylcysteine O-methyltransferase Ste14
VEGRFIKSKNENMRPDKKPPSVWEGQTIHFAGLILLVGVTWLGWSYLDRPNPVVFWSAVGIPVAHQIYVWLCWRLELQSSKTSNTIGFNGYVIGFFVLFGGRFLSLLVLAIKDADSLGLSVFSRIVLTSVCAFLGVYAMYSTMRYFGMDRASGADHFKPEYRDMPLVKKGIFRFTNNGMYLYAFLLFWAVGFGFNSSATLLVAAFSHAYIWIHFFATEKPDMNFLYG